MKQIRLRRTHKVEPDEQLELSCRHLHTQQQPSVVHVPAHLDEPKYSRRGRLIRGPVPRYQWKYMEHLQEIADILADPDPPQHQINALSDRHHLPLINIAVDASELVAGAMTAGYWWWVGISPQATLLCAQPDCFRYLRQREARTIHGIPWETAQLGLMQDMLGKHREWKIKRLRASLMRHLWDFLPHGRTFAKNGEPIPPCPICHTDIDDVHHILVECQDTRLKTLRLATIRQALLSDKPFLSFARYPASHKRPLTTLRH